MESSERPDRELQTTQDLSGCRVWPRVSSKSLPKFTLTLDKTSKTATMRCECGMRQAVVVVVCSKIRSRFCCPVRPEPRSSLVI
jgi:hypothetical protein